ncbi:hypothetical protein MNEG_5099 [Monoraphidium neglectum]|uniref:Uncharacterized protein n=1 Tax=Monoraphidium neglectum TaxID=145388 RepID=A0A0D2MII8_9CHLO|nr:hypothetical protein MNEG_5099 [Monoraphidium neglectum]KIZ02855.1 hypothetical protein MNEG_5099 [Monoraphidium neglectum]|eukprot:XP_013901874.1 hypothetical protein MNEG_5099 [Monoraphidium neglectum]
MGREITVAVAGAATAALAVVAYKHLTSYDVTESDAGAPAQAYLQLLVFVDSPGNAPKGKVLRWPRRGPVSDLIAAVGALLGLETPRVFLESTREELLPTLDSLDALDAASGCAQRLVLLIATAGAALSDAAAKLPPLQQPPRGPRPLPGLGNALCFKGPYEVPMYNAWHNLFAPGKQEVWGDTVRLVLPEAFSTSGDSEGAGGWDDELALIETVVTTDPEGDWGAQVCGRSRGG